MAVDASKEPPIVPDADNPIKPDKTNTLADVFDPTDTDFGQWFSAIKGVSDVSSGNEVIPYIRGTHVFKDMVAAIKTATKPGHFIYMLGCNCGARFQLVPGDPGTTLSHLLKDADARGVDIRAMFYKHVATFTTINNDDVVKIIDGLTHGSVIHDERVMEVDPATSLGLTFFGMGSKVGAHHQKILVVHGSEGLIAFQGGYDIVKNRLTGFGPGGAFGLHDVHTRIMGTCAWFLYDIFAKRWVDHPESKGKKPVNTKLSVPSPHPANLFVQIAHTYPNAKTNSGVAPGGYGFAPAGEQSCKKMILNAISKAKEFIYLEDQYLVDMSISNALKAALPKLKSLVILIVATESINGELFQATRRRKEVHQGIAWVGTTHLKRLDRDRGRRSGSRSRS